MDHEIHALTWIEITRLSFWMSLFCVMSITSQYIVSEGVCECVTYILIIELPGNAKPPNECYF